MVDEENVLKSSNVMDWKYKQWLRIVTVVVDFPAVGRIFLDCYISFRSAPTTR